MQSYFSSSAMSVDQKKNLHDTEMNYRCWHAGCYQAFSDGYRCCNHYISEHLSLKTFGCKGCNDRYSVYEDLIRHMSTAHCIDNSDIALALVDENLPGWIGVQTKMIKSLMNARAGLLQASACFSQKVAYGVSGQETLEVPELPAALLVAGESSLADDDALVSSLDPKATIAHVAPPDVIVEAKLSKKNTINISRKISCPLPACRLYGHTGNIRRHYRNVHVIANCDDRKAFLCLFEQCSGKYPDLDAIKHHLKKVHNVQKNDESKFIHKDVGLWDQIQAIVETNITESSPDVPKKYACSLCEKSFKVESALSRHRNAVHVPKKLMCPTCKKYATNDPDALKKHFQKHLIQKDPSSAPFVCLERECEGMTFLTARRYKEHVENIHRKNLSDDELNDNGKRHALNMLANAALNIGSRGHKKQKTA